ncbi:MAG: cob(I)yrinic acid a,c-diamide adenosyltransferase [Eubacteriales bacterium]|nr:cob(I)yrinic acid a,c-diamide adenosyltransferase [Eubacteriales bacterium]
MNQGKIQVYTGDGKGKTTAAIGLSIRALGAGKKVLFLQFMKSKEYSEHSVLENISKNFKLQTLGKPFFIARKEDMNNEEYEKWKDECVFFEKGNPPAEYLEMINKGLKELYKTLKSEEYDLIILDEVNVALYFDLINKDEFIKNILNRNPGIELVLTGRKALPEIIEIADLVTEMVEIKHYYNTQNLEARKGIEN